MEFLRCPLIVQYYSRKRKIAVPCLKLKLKYIVYLLKKRTMNCLRIGQKICFVLRSLKAILKSEVERVSLQQLEYEMDCADIPDDYIYIWKMTLWSP